MEARVYLEAVNEELRRSGHGVAMPRRRLSRKNRPNSIERWCREQRIPPPRKVLVANRIAEMRSERTVVEPNQLATVCGLQAALAAVFET